eukprot:7574542-Alexandrium_andersonii.AAC.1
MSASLVGSEMCIRDRWQPLCLRRSSRDQRNGWRAWGGAGERRPSGAVSYTHLTLPTICSV